jgi:hypothetical protein
MLNTITNFLYDYSLLKITIDNDVVELFFIGFIIHSICLFLFGLLSAWMDSKCTWLYSFLNLIYCVLNDIFSIFFGIGIIFLLGDIGIIIFITIFTLFFVFGFIKLMIYNDVYLFNLGIFPKLINENYISKRNFYINLNKEYNEFKQYNQEII